MESAESSGREFFVPQKLELYSVDPIRLTLAPYRELKVSAEWYGRDFFIPQKPEWYSATPIRLTSAPYRELKVSDAVRRAHSFHSAVV